MALKLVKSMSSLLVLFIHIFASSSFANTQMIFDTKSTSYYPYNNRLQGGHYDRRGKRLYTLQAYLAGKAPYVSVAMDDKTFKYNSKIQIPFLERYYNRPIEFRVVDTGSAFAGQGTGRIDICTQNSATSVHSVVNSRFQVIADSRDLIRPVKVTSYSRTMMVSSEPVKPRLKLPWFRKKSEPRAQVRTDIRSSDEIEKTARAALLENRELIESDPRDMASFCPRYYDLDLQTRADVWSQIILGLARSSSGLDTNKSRAEQMRDSSGLPIVNRGLLQISWESARGYGCSLNQQAELHEQKTNIQCGVKIMQKLIAKDAAIGDASARQGLGRYWGDFRDSGFLKDLQTKISANPRCQIAKNTPVQEVPATTSSYQQSLSYSFDDFAGAQ